MIRHWDEIKVKQTYKIFVSLTYSNSTNHSYKTQQENAIFDSERRSQICDFSINFYFKIKVHKIKMKEEKIYKIQHNCLNYFLCALSCSIIFSLNSSLREFIDTCTQSSTARDAYAIELTKPSDNTLFVHEASDRHYIKKES